MYACKDELLVTHLYHHIMQDENHFDNLVAIYRSWKDSFKYISRDKQHIKRIDEDSLMFKNEICLNYPPSTAVLSTAAPVVNDVMLTVFVV